MLARLLEDNPEYLTKPEVQRLLGENEALAKKKKAEKEAYEATLPGASMNSKFGKFLANWEQESGAFMKKLQDYAASAAIALGNTATSLGQAFSQSVQNQLLLTSDSSYEGLRDPADYLRVAAEAFEGAFKLGPAAGEGGGEGGASGP